MSLTQAINLSQVHHAAAHAAPTVTREDVESELEDRGYTKQVHVAPVVHVHIVPEKPRITKAQAVAVAVDAAIDTYSAARFASQFGEIPKTTSHPYRCPTGSCPLNPQLYDAIVGYGVSLANYYLGGGTIPTWAASMLRGLALGQTTPMGGLADWIKDNPWALVTIGQGISAYGAHLTAKNVEETVKKNIPSGMLTKEDLPILIQMLRQQGVIPPGKEEEVSEGITKAAMPGWMTPLLIGGGVLAALMLFRR